MGIYRFQLLMYHVNPLPAIIYTIGAMGSGKTFLSLFGYYAVHYYNTNVKRYGLKTKLYYYNASECGVECIDYFISEAKKEDVSTLRYAVFDDYSFALVSKTKEYYDFLNKMFRIRHLIGSHNAILWFNGHYSRSLAPFIRSTNYRILTSISPAEIKQYASEYLFTESDLWQYYEYYVLKPKRKIILAHFKAVSKIIDVTAPKKVVDKIREIAKEHGIPL